METRDRRAHAHESGSHCFLFFLRGSCVYLLFTSLAFVVRSVDELDTLRKE